MNVPDRFDAALRVLNFIELPLESGERCLVDACSVRRIIGDAATSTVLLDGNADIRVALGVEEVAMRVAASFERGHS